MKTKKKLIIGIIVLLLITLVIGVSFAIWQLLFTQTNENTITSGCFKIEFQDQSPIDLEKAYPISDEEGKKLVPYEFTITNTCESFASYQINLEILNTTTLTNLDYMKLTLNEKTNRITENETTSKTLENATTSYKLKTGYLREKQEKTFELRVWMDEETPAREEFMNKIFKSKVTVIATYKEDLENKIETSVNSQNEGYAGTETFQIHVTSENYDLVSMSEDLENWEELEEKGKEITVEKTVRSNGMYTYYFQDEAENVQEVSIEATKIDDQKPTANMSVTKTNNVISIDASASKDKETSVVKYYYSKDGINFDETTSNTYEFRDNYEYGKATETLINYERNETKKVYVKVEDEVGNKSDRKELEIASDFAYDATSDNNLRYIGKSPNNYVRFNDELWRIIGVMNNIEDGNGNLDTRIKLIRNESIGEYSWDSSAKAINGGFGVNEWSVSDVKVLLNDYYYNAKSNQSCYNGKNNVTIACDFSISGLSLKSRDLIGNTLWHTGASGIDVDNSKIFTVKSYELERSNNTGKICSGGTNCNDGISRTTTWLGPIGLIYPSDYGYATSGDITDRMKCLSMSLLDWSEETNASCRNNSWLYDQNINQWTMMPRSVSAARADIVFAVLSNGRVGIGMESANAFAVKPTIYLKENINIISGIGVKDNPFVFHLS